MSLNSLSVTLGDLLAMWREPLTRHPVVRAGERAAIPLMVRLSVYQRDGRRCRACGLQSPDLELDHIVPWSAGGGDHSSNLRTLCHECNAARSNYRDEAEDRLPVPTTLWCWHCWRHPELEVDDPDICDWQEPRSPFRMVWKDGTNPAAAPYVTDEDLEHVYCAHCSTYSVSNVLFSAEMQDRLAGLCDPTWADRIRADLRAEVRGETA